jgi:hypothetical protein
MSGMFEPKSDKLNRKMARTRQEEKEKKKTRKVAVSVIVAFALLLSVSLVANSNFIRRTLPVFTIDGISFNTAEFEYFYNVQIMDQMNFMRQFQGMGGSEPDWSRSLSGQIFNHDTGETWAQWIKSATLDRMSGLVQLYNAAVYAGFTLPDEQIELIDEDMANVTVQALMYGISSENLLQRTFGNSMNERLYRSISEFIATANSYSDHVRDSFTYTTQELNDYYAENADSLDVINYRLLTVFAEHPDMLDAQDDITAEDAAVIAHETASEIAEGIESQDDFIMAAMFYNYDVYSNPDSTLRMTQGERIDAVSSEWLLEPGRSYGDITLIDTSQGTNILFFVSRDDNSYETVGMRQILIMRDHVSPMDFDLGEDDPEYLFAFDEAEMQARDRAESALELFITEGATMEALIGLMDEHSDDTTEGGYYSQISKLSYHGATFSSMKVVPEIEDWLFDGDRKEGDFELIYTSDFGYHLIYFTGFYERLSELISDDRQRTAEHGEWLDSLTSGEPVRHFAFILVNM